VVVTSYDVLQQVGGALRSDLGLCSWPAAAAVPLLSPLLYRCCTAVVLLP